MTNPFVTNLALHLKDIPQDEIIQVIKDSRKLLDEVEEKVLYPVEREPELACGEKLLSLLSRQTYSRRRIS